MTNDALFDIDDFAETRGPSWEPIYVMFPSVDGLAAMLAEQRCRDCGVKVSWMTGGGSRPGLGSFQVCEDCAQLDACRLRCCEPVAERRRAKVGVDQWECAHCDCGWWEFETYWHDEGEHRSYTAEEITDMLAEHAIPRHVSHWGKSHFVTVHDDLVKAQARRRAAFLAKRVAA